MANLKVLWKAPSPRSYKHVLFRYCEKRSWLHHQNWKFNLNLPHWNIITPMLRFTKCNGKIELGLGNHYFVIGW